MTENGNTESARLALWHDYYGEKRIGQQWFQAHLLADLRVQRVLEVGPYLGLVTALLDNAGYSVTTLDHVPQRFSRPKVDHIEADLLGLRPETIGDFDLILCCETLEHLPWEKVGGVLRCFQESGARYLITSVPYEGLQIHFLVDWNLYGFRQRFAFRKGRSLRTFQPPTEVYGHHWEVGYRGFSLKTWDEQLNRAGWRTVKRYFTAPRRSVFHVLENRAASGQAGHRS